MRELYQGGNTVVHKFIAENCSWISEVKEFDVMMPSSSCGDTDSVKRELTKVLDCVEACMNCILAGNAKN